MISIKEALTCFVESFSIKCCSPYSHVFFKHIKIHFITYICKLWAKLYCFDRWVVIFSDELKIAIQSTNGEVIGFVFCAVQSKLNILRSLIVEEVSDLWIWDLFFVLDIIDWLIIYCYISHLRIFYSYGDITIAC
jgi:hypothetical protein